MTTQEHNYGRLPKWVREEISQQRREIDSLTAKLTKGPEGSTTFVRDYASGHRPLGAARIIFAPGGDPEHYEGGLFEAYLEDGELIIHGSGGAGLAIRPWASNVIRIAIQPRRPWK